ncbi:MAG: outer membrane beta-barrel protein [Thermoanaerobaculia bacterium]
MKRLFLALAVVSAAGLGSTAVQAQTHQHGRTVRGHVGENNVLRFQLARLTPRGEGNYWPEKELTFTGSADDFEDLSFTLDYQRLVTNRISVMLSAGFFEGAEDQAYLDFIDDLGNDIVHRTTLERAAFTVGLLVHPLGRDAVVSPYLGGGLGAYLWRLTESGDFINFNVDPPFIFTDTFEDEGDAFGHYWIVGLEVPLSWSWAAFAEARWHNADQELGGADFIGFGELDLSSREVGVGVSVSF